MRLSEFCRKNRWTLLSLVTFLVSIAAAVYLYKTGMLTSVEALQEQVDQTGVFGALLFIIIQAVQVIIPIIPGGISCLAGVVLFGAVKGFLWNYIGICIGSVIAFFISRNCGKPILYKIFSQKTILKYEKWTDGKSNFTKLFALAIFLPVAPDDFLCYLAGTTSMKLQAFITIILLGKPFAIAAYSLGLYQIFQFAAA